MKYWLMKTEPETFGWEDMLKDGKAVWDGVRNYAARLNMIEMKKGDTVVIYHSVKDRNAVGLATVTKEHYPDPTTNDDRWVAVDLKPEKALKRPVNLTELKKDPRMEQCPLVRISRLSVLPLTQTEYDTIIELSQNA